MEISLYMFKWAHNFIWAYRTYLQQHGIPFLYIYDDWSSNIPTSFIPSYWNLCYTLLCLTLSNLILFFKISKRIRMHPTKWREFEVWKNASVHKFKFLFYVLLRKICCYLSFVVNSGHAACIQYMCVTPKDLNGQLGEFADYCPVSLAESNELHDCSTQSSHELVAEYRGKYYRFSDHEKMEVFLQCPSKYVLPLAPNALPAKEDLPKKRGQSYLKKIFPQEIELKGYCPVTFYDGNFRYFEHI